MQNLATAAPLPATEPAFELVLARSHLRLPVQPGESMADVLQLAGIAIDTLCEQGVCGTCATRWLDGTPDHRDSCLSPEEQSTHVAVCCARSHGPTLTLDL
ncbi:2Fe-2S iron-sulfur cluster binding domain-containing protein [Acidovorax sp. Root219]|uniref:2Fe-2S iron-sulfur cluster-binding protein n=1 Tax=Acidovorax sp. Root219 TaxID=1736493 RepID=UPI00070DAF63|nr:2Fe-2S iron-sulfur cluster binding domain-containing protein [Acidovorax sp. Root219]KRC33514.1 ferredoxin [Acidovorax sp. Root219]